MQGVRFLSSQIPRISILRTISPVYAWRATCCWKNKRPLVMYTDVFYIIGEGSRGTGGLYDDIRITNTRSVSYVQISAVKVLRTVNQLPVTYRGVSRHCIRRCLLSKSLEAPSEAT